MESKQKKMLTNGLLHREDIEEPGNRSVLAEAIADAVKSAAMPDTEFLKKIME